LSFFLDISAGPEYVSGAYYADPRSRPMLARTITDYPNESRRAFAATTSGALNLGAWGIGAESFSARIRPSGWACGRPEDDRTAIICLVLVKIQCPAVTPMRVLASSAQTNALARPRGMWSRAETEKGEARHAEVHWKCF
jgi:hypothetical protein